MSVSDKPGRAGRQPGLARGVLPVMTWRVPTGSRKHERDLSIARFDEVNAMFSRLDGSLTALRRWVGHGWATRRHIDLQRVCSSIC